MADQILPSVQSCFSTYFEQEDEIVNLSISAKLHISDSVYVFFFFLITNIKSAKFWMRMRSLYTWNG